MVMGKPRGFRVVFMEDAILFCFCGVCRGVGGVLVLKWTAAFVFRVQRPAQSSNKQVATRRVKLSCDNMYFSIFLRHVAYAGPYFAMLHS